MNNIIDTSKVKLKTYSFYINNKNDKKIFDYMTSISKYIYNCTLYCYKVYKRAGESPIIKNQRFLIIVLILLKKSISK